MCEIASVSDNARISPARRRPVNRWLDPRRCGLRVLLVAISPAVANLRGLPEHGMVPAHAVKRPLSVPEGLPTTLTVCLSGEIHVAIVAAVPTRQQGKRRKDRAARIYERLKGARGLDDAELWQHALFFAMPPQQRCRFSLQTARSALSLRRSARKA